MTNDLASTLNDVHAKLCRYNLILDAYLEAICIVDQSIHPRMFEVVDGLRRAAEDVLTVKEAIEAEQKQETFDSPKQKGQDHARR